jgi:hypothetical protein
MKSATFTEGVLLALVSSLVGAISYTALLPIVDGELAICFTIAFLGLGYIIYLLKRSGERIGLLSTIVIWAVITVVLFIFIPSPLLFLTTQLGLIWIIRSLYFYTSVISAVADLALVGFSLMATIWATYQTESIFLSIWCCLLVNSLFVFIPVDMNQRVDRSGPAAMQVDRFQEAYQVAESALKQSLRS